MAVVSPAGAWLGQRARLGWFQADQLLGVVLHETAHVARGDLWAGLLQRSAAAMFWWCAPLHRLNRLLGDVREEMWDKSQAELMNILTPEQRAKFREHEIASQVEWVKTVTNPVSLTEEQWTRIRAAFKEDRKADDFRRLPQAIEDVLTAEQKQAIA
jgi:hypothetical protein